ncbi:hypothetical protein [Streptomyces sp. NPDC127119]|uniref:hypothetical protein n=1 Tax=Streptomyces sp. NPDC127119 TaxID=3345370 RepID=UPI00362A9A21
MTGWVKRQIPKMLSACGLNKTFLVSAFSWLCFNLVISSAPILLTLFTLPRGGDWDSIGERGDFFIVTAALLAAEMPTALKAGKGRKGNVAEFFFALYFLQVFLCVAAFAVTTANFTSAHTVNVTASPKESIPFVGFDSSTTMAVSLMLYGAGVVTIMIGMAWRCKGKAGDVDE